MDEIQLQVGTKAFLINRHNQYLLTKRSDKYANIIGRWDIVGGRIQPGTSLLENLQREVTEETNLTIVGTPRLISAQDILHVPGKHIVRLTYLAMAQGEVTLQQEEATEYRWYSWEELSNLADLDQFVGEIISTALQPIHTLLRPIPN